jgi:hypothetical protein
MLVYSPKVIPVALFPGDWCLKCADPLHPNAICHMLEMSRVEDGTFAVGPCGCDTSISPNAPGKYVVRVTELQKE